jgi:hypothetical protein
MVLEAPTLEELLISFEPGLQGAVDPSFLRTSCRTLLRLGVEYCKTPTLMEIVRYTPGIVHLSLDSIMDLSDILGWLAGQTQADPVPHLQSLTIRPSFCIIYDEQFEELYELIRSRAVRGATECNQKIQSLHIKSLSVCDEDNRLALGNVEQLCEVLDVRFELDYELGSPLVF